MHDKYRRQQNALLFAIGIAVALPLSAFAAEPNEHGKALYEQCVACHSLEPDMNGIGPTLNGVFGRRAGTLSNFRYSPALRRSAIVWDAKTLDEFVQNPQQSVPANRMPYSGMKAAEDRTALIDYLRAATALH
jgi:cytochrome c